MFFRYHLQALRHLYVLAAQPRLMLPRPLPHNSKLKFEIEYLDGRKIDCYAPILLPPLHLMKKVKDTVGYVWQMYSYIPYLRRSFQFVV